MTTSHPAFVHGRSLAVVHHFRTGDLPAVAALLNELTSPVSAGATISSLVQVVNRLLDDRDDGDQWLQAALLHLAQQEGDPPPGAA